MMGRSILSRRRWARSLLAPLAPATLWFAGCSADPPVDEHQFEGLHKQPTWFAYTAPDAHVSCLNVIVTERPSNLPVMAMRVHPTSTEYTHIGGTAFTKIDGDALVDLMHGKYIDLTFSHPAGYQLAQPQQSYTSSVDCRKSKHGNTCTCDDVFVFVTLCGNGIKQKAEECDDGNSVNGDGCDSNCTMTTCGNAVVTMGEACDDGNATNDDGCDNNCTFTACGNGIVTGVEVCDDGNHADGDGCDSNCKVTGCGNGIKTAGEDCDDGNQVNGDTCDNNCAFPKCGNGETGAPETCDDGNQVNGDGCDNNCTVTGCGNGIVTGIEQCDDANSNDNDGCRNDCTIPLCGDGFVDAGEQCDDGGAAGNQNNGDGCDNNCTSTACGNGIATANTGEQCDDGNTIDDDGCTNGCKLPFCGDGILQAGEGCDDGNQVNGDGCDANCIPILCGNGIVTPGEQCDDGNHVNGDGCDSNCTLTACTNGIVTAGEQCDDGNINNGDGCDSNCTLTACTNGIVTAGEQCDDGNINNGDGCDNNCTPTGCTNGIVTGSEYCDDGDSNNLNACNNHCVAPGTLVTVGGYGSPSGGQDQGHAIAIDGSNQVFVAGYATVAGQGFNAWIGKFPPNAGAPLWTAHHDGPASGHDFAYGIATDPSSGSAVVIGAETTTLGDRDIFLAKHNGNTGAQIWKVTDGTTGDDIGLDVTVDGNGNIALVGVLNGPSPSFWVARYKPDATLYWKKTPTGTTGFANDKVSISMDPPGNVTACGVELSQSGSADKVLVIKYASNGTLISANSFDAIGYHPTAARVDASGNVIVTGYNDIAGSDTNIVTAKYGPLFNLLWTNEFGGVANLQDRGSEIRADALGNILVTGYTYVSGQGINVWVRKLSPNGTVAWTNEYNGLANANDYGTSIGSDADGNIFVTGYDAVSGQSSNVWWGIFAP